jgi:hypothetical protein
MRVPVRISVRAVHMGTGRFGSTAPLVSSPTGGAGAREVAQAQRRDLRLLLISGHAEDAVASDGKPADPRTSRGKPYTRQDLALKVREAPETPD